ncbi:uncharacterized protein UV8b_07560 [Ustilaginoidea virens]|uniref:Uncharacterized protein n=1 Tax=Ustilaginoidea virens TaxID=1159556 RepID=A0A8E5HXC5_USTVR|nr:uncharacterized protein UV8b_07560 [Ustilaginoidea virens]QUC23319.1 hypothetical protein UV8b_07560 [Ustilaginoidea virens]
MGNSNTLGDDDGRHRGGRYQRVEQLCFWFENSKGSFTNKKVQPAQRRLADLPCLYFGLSAVNLVASLKTSLQAKLKG